MLFIYTNTLKKYFTLTYFLHLGFIWGWFECFRVVSINERALKVLTNTKNNFCLVLFNLVVKIRSTLESSLIYPLTNY